MVIRALLLTMLISCTYDATLQDCHLTCTAATGCPDGFSCGTEGLCRLEGVVDSCAVVLVDGGSDGDNGSDASVVEFTPSNLGAADDLTAGVQDITIGTAVIDTDAGTITGVTTGGVVTRIQAQATGPEIQVFRFRSLRIQGAVTVQGSRALALVTATTLTVSGSMQFTGQIACVSGTSGDGTSSGGGAGFGTAGGAGALGDMSTVAGGAGPARGSADLIPLLTGCRGAPGKTSAASAALGGAGGGAVQLVAGARIDISGSVCVPGLGGAIGLDTVGSGGGGSGGAILLEAPVVSVTATGTLTANGGGGGGSSGPFGADGQPGGFSCTTGAAAGGAGDGTAGSGGDGGFNATAPQPGTSGIVGTAAYAGGGGGAVGRIRINRMDNTTPSGMISPAASLGDLQP